MTKHFIGLYVFSGALCAFISAAVTFASGRKNGRTVLTTILLVATSLLLFEHYFTHYYRYPYDFEKYPADTIILLMLKNLKFLIGPSILLLYSSLRRRDGGVFSSLSVFHLAGWTAGSAAIFVTASYVRAGSIRGTTGCDILGIIDLSALLHIAGYIIAIFVDTVRMYLSADRERSTDENEINVVRSMLRASAMTFFAVALLIFFALFSGSAAETTALIVVATIAFVLSFDPRLRSGAWEKAERAVRKVRYARSLLAGVDTDLLEDRLADIMEDGKIYCDEDLSLERLASMAEISPHMLSEFINSKFGMNFNSYINSYRVAEAKSLLADDADRSVLSVGFASGFNSKSAFYRVFTEIEGVSPGEYRTRLENERKNAS
ncbi:MAG TPA: helix-turn-helix domain-containing protein [Spirochaetota bacterium]|nr:helix-turn-helix domain-containing protein [Spirochaetota bacterium]